MRLPPDITKALRAVAMELNEVPADVGDMPRPQDDVTTSTDDNR